jgi:hypothetical protein
MAAVIHKIDSLWICESDVDTDDDGNVEVSTVTKRDAGPADTTKVRLPTEAYAAQLLFPGGDDNLAGIPIAVLLKPTTTGQTMLFFGSAPVLRDFADRFFPFD